MSLAAEDMIQHFLFHKSILEEDEGGERLNNYMHLVNQAAEGRHMQIEDPWLRTTATVFELMMAEDLDPWDVDLKKFASAYRKQIKKSDFVDFITAGRLTNLAWSILARKTSTLVLRAEEPVVVEESFFADCSPWDMFAPEDPFVEVTEQIRKSPPLEERIYHAEEHRVGLLELMDAFEEVRREAELMEKIKDVRDRLRKEQRIKPDISKKIHKEDLEGDINRVWKTVSSINKDFITMDDIFIRDRDDYVTVFVALLFLAKAGRVELKQTRPPVGKLQIILTAPYEERNLFGLDSVEDSPEIEKETREEVDHIMEEPIEVAA